MGVGNPPYEMVSERVLVEAKAETDLSWHWLKKNCICRATISFSRARVCVIHRSIRDFDACAYQCYAFMVIAVYM